LLQLFKINGGFAAQRKAIAMVGARHDAVNILVVSDFNAQNLASLLSNRSIAGMQLRATAAPFGQVMQLLLAPRAEAWKQDLTAAVVWTSPQAVSKAYANALAYKPLSIKTMADEVKAYASALGMIPPHVEFIFVPTWVPLHSFQGRRGLLDMDSVMGPAAALMKMNLTLAEAVQNDKRIHLFDSARWIASAGERSYDARMWYLSKTPFAIDVFKEATRDFVAAIRGIRGGARKLVILDLDDTLWGGIVGDIGWKNLRLGGHDAVGEAYRDFQLELKALARRGILLGIASKNEERTALEAINCQPEMVLALDDFAGWRINWNDKVENIIELVSDLNLGLESAVFIDDNPAERARVREALPTLLVPEWPKSALHYATALRALDCFDAPFVSTEDCERTAMYVSERKRKQLQDGVPSLETWLSTLELRVQVEELNAGNLERTTQLLNKTNQMNLRTRRMSSRELAAWACEHDHQLLVFRVADRFGDYGLVGIAALSLDQAAGTAEIEDFVLSCRVMGRKVEETMLHALATRARAAGAISMSAEYLATPKNQPCLRFFEMNGVAEKTERQPQRVRFHWNLSKEYPLPGFVTLSWVRGAEAGRSSLSSDHAVN
jgi:FkbH-like protein